MFIDGLFRNEEVNESRNCVLNKLLTWLGVPLVLDQWFKQTIFVSYFTKMIPGSIRNGPAKKSDTMF